MNVIETGHVLSSEGGEGAGRKTRGEEGEEEGEGRLICRFTDLLKANFQSPSISHNICLRTSYYFVFDLYVLISSQNIGWGFQPLFS